MINGKVRIYELSRELNLENKDILAVCERLDIAVKSHSSTIPDEDAARIRAELQQVGGKTALKPNKPSPPRNRQAPEDLPKTEKRPVRKQEILEIRRHKPKTTAKPPEAPSPQSVEASQPSPPQGGGDTATVTPPPSRPSRPVRPSNRQPEVGEPSAPRPSTPPPTRPTKPIVAPRSSVEAEAESPVVDREDEELVVAPEPIVHDRPTVELVRPPSRPEKPARPTKPSIIKRDRTVRPDASGSGTIPIREVDDDESTQLKPKPELRRPASRPSRRGDEDADDQATTATDDDATPGLGTERDDPETLLRRPTLPRKSRKPTAAREREDEEQERKPSKTAKTKRRGHGVIEDEDEVLADLTDADGDADETSPSHLSVSLARPAKQPKARGGPSPKAASIPRAHKPTKREEGGGNSRQQRRDRRNQGTQEERPEMITLTGGLSVHELADLICVPETDIIKSLFFKGIATNINQTLDVETAQMVAEEFEILVETAEAESEAIKVTEMLDATDMESLVRRPPVVTIMGHVDHGKTTLLDFIRKAKVAQGEAGGITQHIGAYHVDIEHGGQSQQIVFLDTPGHEAFTAMRARGARVTDIAILVVAADDGVRPQTIEAISHAKAAKVPIVVAVNKIDKEAAQPDRVKQELMEHGLVPEEWGGDTIMVPLSALSGENVDTLLEMLLLVSEVEDLQANPDRLAKGTVIEANLDKARGPVATLLVQNGTLKIGDSLVVGPVFGKVRAMIDDLGHRVKTAGPSFAVEVLGLGDVPAAGDEFDVYTDEKEARAIADSRATTQRQSRLQQAMASRRVTLSSLSAQAQEGELKELNLILKSDVQGSVEAILAALQQLPQGEVQIRVLLAAPGEISETDVDLAAASGAALVGFNTTLASGARQAADRQGVDVRDYDIIYNLLDDIQAAMEGLLEPELVEEPLGQVEVRAVFGVRRGSVAGCYVQSGKVTRNCRVRVRRKSEVVYEGNLDSLKRMKEDVKEVASGFECGIGVDNFNAWIEGDIIEAFKLVTQRRTLAPA
ncbi:translation initiation factor IF-2 [Leptolyngbya sp. PCC 6406]|uniref:translation initiation factor IF-2 n=1 Tax=Leptolyngbya sp. PCC 6406 TaxID=1173264 RepID=UPI0002AD07B6|nr:translation initiation factor IF-2 [Leptolyngbya sp. PCC 6406]